MDGVVYTYYYEGSRLMRMTVGTSITMDFFYDQNGQPFAMKYNSTMLYYVLNAQGDVVRIVNASGGSYGIYKYDAWGNILYITDNQYLNNNPLRYRGYVYDSESSLYYCQSRYYDPAIGRFLNADAFASTGQGLLGNNMFAYCNNNPVVYVDHFGTMPKVFPIAFGNDTRQRDVTSEVMLPLIKSSQHANRMRTMINALGLEFTLAEAMLYVEFYQLVNHSAPWDIKREKPWQDTIGTPYPGLHTELSFNGTTMTPEMLGNYAYGYLGHSYGIPLLILIAGSYYAAGFPTAGNALENEIWDWGYIVIGYDDAKSVNRRMH